MTWRERMNRLTTIQEINMSSIVPPVKRVPPKAGTCCANCVSLSFKKLWKGKDDEAYFCTIKQKQVKAYNICEQHKEKER